MNPSVTPKWAAAVTEFRSRLALAWRRRFPILVVAVVSLGLGLEASLGVPVNEPVVPLLVIVIAVFSVSVNEPLRRSVTRGRDDPPGLCRRLVSHQRRRGRQARQLRVRRDHPGGVWMAGRLVRARTREAGRLARETDRLEAERLIAVAQERARIARELHDVIAHSVSVMVVQAEAAQEVLKRDPQRAVNRFEAVQETGRQAMVEMSRLVGLLREDDEEMGLAPQPGLSDLETLAHAVREAGLSVDPRTEGEPTQIPLGVDLSAYRVVQEALTNAIKHAGPARAQVTVRYCTDWLELEVLDDGPGTGNGHVGGHGLVGMRERITVFGGRPRRRPARRRWLRGAGAATAASLPKHDHGSRWSTIKRSCAPGFA